MISQNLLGRKRLIYNNYLSISHMTKALKGSVSNPGEPHRLNPRLLDHRLASQVSHLQSAVAMQAVRILCWCCTIRSTFIHAHTGKRTLTDTQTRAHRHIINRGKYVNVCMQTANRAVWMECISAAWVHL